MTRLQGFALLAGLLMAGGASAADAVHYTAPGKAPVDLDTASLARTEVKAGAHGDAPTAWQGVDLIDVLRAQGAPVGKDLRGKALSDFVRITAADGYQVIFSLGELDPDFGGRKVVLVDKHEGKPLDAKDGPYRIVVPDDSRPARWIHSVTAIELVEASTAEHRKP
ncbi:molybdopterin-dependent oxidoreductase [Luteibacter aegosomatissinici]|uniref:molybdopterin-dependent oxidoreductase n=1 Tax=Luteibacter aegosomatissinici TaxID=2911539 RepID=UPI001FF98EE4|nr:molybdopterin-dependent oxidoreductase [Luteibacter aegosomatissinici]UPG96277.1 molybdopterin-dependent oxidoreductase [Luteibacter aegosomatissinici]